MIYKLFEMKSFDLEEIYTESKVLGGKIYTIGIKFIFHGEKEPITYGKFDGAVTSLNRALFKSSEQISTIKCSGEITDEGNKYRLITFFGKDGEQTEV